MSITTISEAIDKVIDGLDEIRHVDASEINSIRTTLENVQTRLDELADEYGDEDGDLEDFGDDEDDGEYA